MNPQDENQDTTQPSAYDPFPEPQTIPAGWDTSEFFAAPQPTADKPAEASTESNSE